MKKKIVMEDVFWSMLPEGLEDFFDLDGYEKTSSKFRLILKEKNIIPADLPEKYQGKKVIDTTLNNIIIDDFPIRGRKGEILLKRRSWKFEGADEWFKQEVKLTEKGTKLEKEFAAFLKELDRF